MSKDDNAILQTIGTIKREGTVLRRRGFSVFWWETVYLICTESYLYICSENKTTIITVVPLVHTTIINITYTWTLTNKKYGFEVKCGEETHLFEASSKDDKSEWIKILKTNTLSTKSTNTKSIITKPIITKPIITKENFRNKYQGPTEDEEVYRGVISAVKDFVPTKTCQEYVLSLSNEDICSKFPFIVSECEKFIQSKNGKTDWNVTKLDENEVFALVIYTWDLHFDNIDQNFYHVLNTQLRKRKKAVMDKFKGYLYYMQKALEKLPYVVTTVYRGVPNKMYIKENYTPNRLIHWSSYSSTSSDIQVAKDFAETSGVILEIKVVTGKSIEGYSPFPEGEILLSPNMRFVVSEPLHNGNDGYDFVTLIQVAPEKTFVF